MLSKLWKWLDGKKTYIGSAITAAAGVVAVAPIVPPQFQLVAQVVLAIAGAGTAAAVGHKIDKAARQSGQPPTPGGTE